MLHGLGILHFHLSHPQSALPWPRGVISLLWLQDLSNDFNLIMKELGT
jgi:hypothetical protein